MGSLKEKFDSKGVDSYALLGEAIIQKLEEYGLGVMPKADIEGLFFHYICGVIEEDYFGRMKELDYFLMQSLKISPSKLRSLRVTRSAKFLNNLDYNSKENKRRLSAVLINATVGNDDIQNGKIYVSIPDPHIQNLIERMIEDNNGVLNRTFNSRLLSLDFEQFLYVAAMIYGKNGEDGYEKLIDEIKLNIKELNQEFSRENIVDELIKTGKEQLFSTVFGIIKSALASQI